MWSCTVLQWPTFDRPPIAEWGRQRASGAGVLLAPDPVGPAGLADDQAARKAIDAFPFPSGDQVQHPPAAFAAELDEVHVDAGERRPRRVGDDLPIVEPDQRDR